MKENVRKLLFMAAPAVADLANGYCALRIKQDAED